MPSRSQAQHRAMEAAAHDRKTAEEMGIPQKVAREFADADEHSGQWKKREHVEKKAAAAGMSPEIFKSLYGGS